MVTVDFLKTTGYNSKYSYLQKLFKRHLGEYDSGLSGSSV